MTRMLEWALYDADRPSGLQKLVLVVLASEARTDGIAWPSPRRLRAGCGWPSGWRLRRAVRQLEEHGELEARPASWEGRPITVYRLACPDRRILDLSKYPWTVERPFTFDRVPILADDPVEYPWTIENAFSRLGDPGRPRLRLISGEGEA